MSECGVVSLNSQYGKLSEPKFGQMSKEIDKFNFPCLSSLMKEIANKKNSFSHQF